MQKEQPPLPPSKKKPFNSPALQYSNIAFQLLAAIFIGVYGGIQLDAYLNTKPWFTVILSLLGISAGFYISLKDLFKK